MSMQAYILATHRELSPFGRPMGDVAVHNRALADLQRESLRALGCTVERIDRIEEVRRLPALVVSDDLYFTHQALVGFMKAVANGAASAASAGSAPCNYRAALSVSMLTERFAPAFQGPQVDRRVAKGDSPIFADAKIGTVPACRAYDCYFLHQFDPGVPLESQAELAPIGHKVGRVRFLANRYFEPSGRFVIPVCSKFMIPLRHWSCLVAANILGMPGHFLRVLGRRPAAALGLPARMAWRAGSLRPGRLLKKLYLAGRRCRIDPSAHVEAAILDSHVKIGPGAVVRGCVIGSGANIGAGAVLEGCTIGPDATVNPGSIARLCVIGREANLDAVSRNCRCSARARCYAPMPACWISHSATACRWKSAHRRWALARGFWAAAWESVPFWGRDSGWPPGKSCPTIACWWRIPASWCAGPAGRSRSTFCNSTATPVGRFSAAGSAPRRSGILPLPGCGRKPHLQAPPRG